LFFRRMRNNGAAPYKSKRGAISRTRAFRAKSSEKPPPISTQLAHARNKVRNELHRTPLDKTSTTHLVSISVAYKLMLLLRFNQGGV
jgi:hypothetical protein